MKAAFKQFWSRPTTRIGIAAAVLFQLVFSVVWMTGYSGVTERADRFQIVLVNEDRAIGGMIAQQLKSNLPFRVTETDRLETAMEQLNRREVHMVIHFPPDLSARIRTPDGKGEIGYWVNESNAILVKSAMQTVSLQVTDLINKQAVAAGISALLEQSGMPAAQAQAASQQLPEKIIANLHAIHPVSGMNNQMVPMMLVLASYVGSMIMAVNVQQSSVQIGNLVGRWQKFAARAGLNLLAAIVTSLVGTSLVLLLGGQSAHGFIALWGFQTLCLLAFMFFSQLFLLLFGQAGMLFNILALSAQLISSGAMVPRELLSDFYLRLGDVLPATYAVEGNMNLLFGGPGIGGAVAGIAAIMAGSIALGALITAWRKENRSPEDAPLSPNLAS
jgi:uncharacterized phage infection (PIP) family protein YhgE